VNHQVKFDARADAAASPSPGAPPIAVGVTGHRSDELIGFDPAFLADRIGEVLTAAEAASPGAAFRLIGSLAPGTETIAADAARARGWQVDAVLPFPLADYCAQLVEPGDCDALSRHLAGAGSIFELPGRADGVGGPAAACIRAGRIVLAQSDLLLALWDDAIPSGASGAAQLVAEAVAQGLPVLVVNPRAESQPVLLWSKLNAHEVGPEALETVARSDLSALPRLISTLAAGGEPVVETDRSPSIIARLLMLAYPLLLAVSGVRKLKGTDFAAPGATLPAPMETLDEGMEARLAGYLEPKFEQADRAAMTAAQLFRGAYVSNFALAALSVTLSLAGLASAGSFKAFLTLAEVASITAILLITRVGGRAGWHERWLRQRRLAERLRCLALSATLGDLMLRDIGIMAGDERTVARSLGLPTAVVDAAYLAEVHRRLLVLLDDQIAYRVRDSARMHLLEHRLHHFGGALFTFVALVCGCVFAVEFLRVAFPHGAGHELPHIPLGMSLLSAALPAIGAAIYGVRMQGDFAGVAERSSALGAQLRGIRTVATDDPPTFDSLLRLVRRTTDLLDQDLGQWFHALRARPLALPG
jgi:hypothetical protein